MTHCHPNRTAAFAEDGRAPVSRRAGGFTYIGVLVLVAMMGLALAAAGQVWHTMQKREKEQELLFIGHQFQLALKRYGEHSQGQARRSPVELEELLKDPRQPGIQRYLRKIYLDPMTGKAEWGLIIAPNGEIFGVHSLSDDEPLKKSQFALADRQFEGKTKYSDWVFMLEQTNAVKLPGGQGQGATAGKH
jgi:type II secretory pathway pseudopilin PulG